MRAAVLLLTLLLATDGVLCLAHLFSHRHPSDPLSATSLMVGPSIFADYTHRHGLTPLLRLDVEKGYGEMFQHAKMFWLAGGFVIWAAAARNAVWLAWAAVFAFLLLDDALQLHERFGALWLRLANPSVPDVSALRIGGVRWIDLSEGATVAAGGGAALAGVGLAYRHGDAAFRRVSRRLAASLLLLAFFGGVMDTVHGHDAVHSRPWLDLAVVLVEDGGEMLAVSLAVFFAADAYLSAARRPSRAGRAGEAD